MRVSLFNRLFLALSLATWLGCERHSEPAPDPSTAPIDSTDVNAGGGEPGSPTDNGDLPDKGSDPATDNPDTTNPDTTDGGPHLLDPNPAGKGQQPEGQPAARQPAANQIDLGYVSSEITAALIVRPHRILSSDFVEKLALGDEIKKSGGFPFDPEKIQRMIVMAAPPADGSPEPRVGGVFQFTDAAPVAEIRETYPFPDVDEVEFEGKTYFRRRPFEFNDEVPSDLPAEDEQPRDIDRGGDIGFDSEPLIRPSQEDDATPCAPEDDPIEDAIPEGALDGAPEDAFGGGLDLAPEENDVAPEQNDGGEGFDEPTFVDDPEAFYFPDEKTAIMAPESLLKSMLAAQDVDTPLTRKLGFIDADHDVIAVVLLAPFADMLKELENAPIPIPPPVKIALALTNQLKSVELTADLTGEQLAKLEIEAHSAEAAEQIALLGTGLLQGLKRQFDENRQQLLGELPPDVGAELLETGDQLLEGALVEAAGTQVTLDLPEPKNWDRLPKLLQPFIAAARAQAQIAKKVNSIRQIGLAMHSSAQALSGFPAIAAPRDEGEHPISWRVKILPFLEQSELYEQYRQDEPWDSDDNLKLLKRMPAIYGDDKEGMTKFRVFTGADTFLLADKRRQYSEVRDGFSNTIMVIQAGEDKATPWTKPEGLPFEADQPLASVGKIADAGLLACFGDGSARVLPRGIKASTFMALITANGNEAIDDDKLNP